MLSFEPVISCFVRSIMGFYYAVAKGRNPGIYHTWDECKREVDKFSGPVFKKFSSSREAQEFIDARTSSSNNCSGSKRNNFVRTRPSQPSYSGTLSRSISGSSKRSRDSKDTDEGTGRVKKRGQPSASGKASSSSSFRNDKDFDMDPDGFVNVYTDGACSGNGYSGAKAGVGVYFGDDSPLNVSAPVVGRATNNMAEIQAVTRAAETASKAGMTKLRVHTDSEFLIKSATQWMPGWKARGWTTASGAPVANRAELQEMESALKPLQVEWNHVRGHRGVYGNEKADELARRGAERYGKH